MLEQLNEKDFGTPRRISEQEVTLEIDGMQVTVAAGTSIMRAAAEGGVNVPKLCATDSLEPFGSCRLCLVEIEGRKGYPASCTTPAEQGMKVRTQSPKLQALRKGVMELYKFVQQGGVLITEGGTATIFPEYNLTPGVTVEQGNAAARGCAINLLAQIKAALGDLDKVVRVVRIGGFVNSAPDFLDGPKVLNGASDLMVAAFGDKGRHARTTVGVASLPADAAVEVEGLFEVS